MKKFFSAVLIGSLSIILVACGGGGSEGSTGTNSTPAPTPTPVNSAPVISGTPASSVTAGNSYTFTPIASDADSGDTLTFTVTNLPAWADFNSDTGEISGTPASTSVGTYNNIVITVSDGTDSASLQAFSVTVNPVPAPPPPPAPSNNPPTISGTPATAITVGKTYSFTPSASDSDSGDTLTFSVANLPAWASFNATTGAISGTPSSSHIGSYNNIVISVSDGTDSASLQAFSITVIAAPNNAPTISGTPASSITEGNAYSFTPSASDADSADTLTFSVANLPSWASFNTSTGALTGTPSSSHVGNYNNIVISVTDGKASASLPAFSIAVNAAPNNAPVISGSPATTVIAGNAYSFTPTASDADSSDTLTFSVSNLPSWASFNTSSGAITGTPASTDVGTFSNIVISVSDGTDTVSLPAFAITVSAPPASKSLTLSWSAPSTYEDGSTLDTNSIGGYRIYLGTSPTNLQVVADINDGTTFSHTISSLSSGTYYLAITTYDANGVESAYSTVVSKTL